MLPMIEIFLRGPAGRVLDRFAWLKREGHEIRWTPVTVFPTLLRIPVGVDVRDLALSGMHMHVG